MNDKSLKRIVNKSVSVSGEWRVVVMSYLVDMLALLGSVQPTVHWTALYSPRLLYSCTDDLSVYSSVTQSVSEWRAGPVST